ncbi:hypothetical protein ACHAW6_001151 [Cyclotella cf. meneghiniana]
MKSIFEMVSAKSWPSIPLLKHNMPSVTWMAVNTSCLTPSWIIDKIPIFLSLAASRSRLWKIRSLFHALPEVESCAVNGKMALPLGKSYQTAKVLALFSHYQGISLKLVGDMGTQGERPDHLLGSVLKHLIPQVDPQVWD